MRTATRPRRDATKAAGTLTRAARAFLLAHARGESPAVPDSVWHGKDSWLLEHHGQGWELTASTDLLEFISRLPVGFERR
jgi:hypothetical protein